MKLASKINKALDKIADQMIGSSNSATHRKLVQSAFRQFSVRVYVAVDDAISKDKDMVIVTGAYSPWKVRQNIEIALNYAPTKKRIKITLFASTFLRFFSMNLFTESNVRILKCLVRIGQIITVRYMPASLKALHKKKHKNILEPQKRLRLMPIAL